ncbi:MAG: hypothetical protein IT433_13415 [Phycisphaerales bacterium]|nr:hypothetical protein [Phycisphaerales bacterium]
MSPTLLLAWRPFLDPLDLHQHWYLLIFPMALLVSLSYKAVRVESLRELPKQTLVMAVQIVLAMIALGFAAWMLVQYVAPMVLPK